MAKVFLWLLRLGIIPLLLATASAQIRENCLPYHSYARALKGYRDEVRARDASRQVRIQQLNLKTDGHLTKATKLRIVEAMKRVTYSADSDWLQEFEGRLSEALQERGYFKSATGQVESRFLSSSAKGLKAIVTAEVEEGQQYALDEITFQKEILRTSSGRIHHRSFGRHGSKGAQYARRIEQGGLREGIPFNSLRIKEFFKRNRAVLPDGAIPEETTIRRDDAAATVAITFNLRGC